MSAPPTDVDTGHPRKWFILSAMCLGLGMLMIDTFVVNVALPSIARDFSADLALTQWVVSAYVLAIAVLPLSMGRMGDIFGRRRVYLLGLLLFIVMSAAAGAAPSMEALVAFRVLQGIGAAVMMPGTLSIITQAFPASQRGLAIGIWGGVSGLGLIAGPLIGGVLVDLASWRLIFLVNLPIGVLAIGAALAVVPESRDESASRSLDWTGLAVLSGGLFLVMLALTRGTDVGWTSAQTLLSFVVGFGLLILFVPVERRARSPLVDLELFRNGTFVAASVSAFLFSAAVFGSQPFLSLFMQNFWGFSPLEGGLAFVPATALVALLLPFSGIVGQRLGSRLRYLLVLASVLVVASSVYVVAFFDLESGYADGMLPPFVIRGLGIGLFMSASSFAVVSAVPLAKSGLASGMLAMSRNIGTAVGIALLGSVHLQYVRTRLTDDLGGSANLDEVIAAAGSFVVRADPAAVPAVEQALVGGFVRIAAATIVLSLIAAVASAMIRERPRRPAEAASPRRLAAHEDRRPLLDPSRPRTESLHSSDDPYLDELMFACSDHRCPGRRIGGGDERTLSLNVG